MKRRIIILAAILMAMAVSCMSTVYKPEQMVNPNIKNRYDFVSDPAGLLDSETKRGVNERLYSLRQTTTCEVVAIVVPDIGDMPIEEWSDEVFTKWGIGKKDKDNGAMLLIVPDQRVVRIQTGYGVEGVLTDIACNNIINRAVIPAMRDDDINRAVNDATSLICEALTDPVIADELRSEQPDNYSGAMQTLSADVIWKFIRIVATIMFFLGMAMFCYDMWRTRKVKGYEQALMWRGHLVTYLVLGIFSMGAGLIFWLLALFLYRKQRAKRRKCPTCGHKMNKLSEEEDNQLLNDSQDFEEQLKTVDYDVWECPQCGTVERFPFRERQTKYKECPRCHTVAMCLKEDIVIQKSTTRREGYGEKVYECEFCHYQDRRPYKIPKKDDDAVAALAAGAIIGSMGRGGGGGGGIGGGFGGGMSGGGGASGSW